MVFGAAAEQCHPELYFIHPTKSNPTARFLAREPRQPSAGWRRPEPQCEDPRMVEHFVSPSRQWTVGEEEHSSARFACRPRCRRLSSSSDAAWHSRRSGPTARSRYRGHRFLFHREAYTYWATGLATRPARSTIVVAPHHHLPTRRCRIRRKRLRAPLSQDRDRQGVARGSHGAVTGASRDGKGDEQDAEPGNYDGAHCPRLASPACGNHLPHDLSHLHILVPPAYPERRRRTPHTLNRGHQVRPGSRYPCATMPPLGW